MYRMAALQEPCPLEDLTKDVKSKSRNLTLGTALFIDIAAHNLGYIWNHQQTWFIAKIEKETHKHLTFKPFEQENQNTKTRNMDNKGNN
jgi:hypothetical protein